MTAEQFFNDDVKRAWSTALWNEARTQNFFRKFAEASPTPALEPPQLWKGGLGFWEVLVDVILRRQPKYHPPIVWEPRDRCMIQLIAGDAP